MCLLEWQDISVKRFLWFLAFASLAHAQVSDVRVDASGNVLNPLVNFPAVGILKIGGVNVTTGGGGGGISDGDKGDITVSGGGTIWTIDPAVVTYAKMQASAAASILVGR